MVGIATTPTKTPKVMMPIGPAAGQLIDLPYALSLLSIEGMGAKSDIQEPMNRKEPAEKLGAMAYHLERVSFALAVIAWQLDPKPVAGYKETADRLVVTLPPGFTENPQAKPKRKNWKPGKKYGAFDPTTE